MSMITVRPPIKYLLRDEFSADLAAGSINGTALTPGPGGNRTVTDTLGVLSISGGKLVYGGRSSNTDPRINYSPPAGGRILIANIDPKSSAYFYGFRFGGATIGMRIESSKISLYGSASNILTPIGTWSGVFKRVVTVITGVNVYGFVDGKLAAWLPCTDTSLSLITASVGNPGADRYPETDYLRIPEAQWVPTPAVYDTFTRANGALGTTEAIGPDGQASPVVAWNGATWTVASGVAKNATTAVLAEQFASLALSAYDVIATCIPAAQAGTKAGMVFGLDSVSNPQNCIVCYRDGDTVKLEELVNGSWGGSPLISATAVYSAGAALRVVKIGNQVSVYYNTVQVGTTSAITANAGTRHGLFSTSENNTIDNFTVFPFGTEGQYGQLNNF